MRRRFLGPVAVVAAIGTPLVLALVAAKGAGPLPPLLPGVSRPDAPIEQPLLVDEPAPVEAPAAPGVPVGPQSSYTAWAWTVAGRTGIPARALQSYAVAEARLAQERPSCRLSWVTLAGIGAVESDHGQHGGRTLRADGTSSARIVGPRLDGAPGVKAIRDTDGGAFDGDTDWDRAVGPLQFIPSTWQDWATDGDANGVADPNDLDDAAVAAGRYLCADGRDLSTPTGWTAAVLSYNQTYEYLNAVHARATSYAASSRG